MKKEKRGVGGICGEYGTSTVGFSVLKNAGDLDVLTVVQKRVGLHNRFECS